VRQEPAESRQAVTSAAAQRGAPPVEQPAAEPAPAPAEQSGEKQENNTPPAQPAKEPATEPVDEPAERPVKKEAPVAKTTEENRGERKGEYKGERKKERDPGRGRDAGKKVVAGANALRARIASIVWLVAVICAAVLAVAALLIALGMNQHNEIVKFITDLASKIDFGKFKDFTGKDAATKEALTNYGISAVIYLIVGKILDRIIRP
jgi:hypothetical protein